MVWVDRFNPVRPRSRPVKAWPYIRKNAYGTLCLVFVAVCAVALAIDPTFFRQMIPELKHHQLIMIGIALIAVPFAIAAVVEDWTLLRHGERMAFDFLLSDKRMLVLAKGGKSPKSVALARITACRLEGSTLILTLVEPSGTARLWDLADPAGALSSFQRALAELRP